MDFSSAVALLGKTLLSLTKPSVKLSCLVVQCSFDVRMYGFISEREFSHIRLDSRLKDGLIHWSSHPSCNQSLTVSDIGKHFSMRRLFALAVVHPTPTSVFSPDV